MGCARPPPQRRHGAEAEGRLFVSRLEEPPPPPLPSPTPHPSPGVRAQTAGEWWQRPFGREEGRRGWGVHPQNRKPGAVGTLGPWRIYTPPPKARLSSQVKSSLGKRRFGVSTGEGACSGWPWGDGWGFGCVSLSVKVKEGVCLRE